MVSRKKRAVTNHRKTVSKRAKRQPKPTVGNLLKRLEVFFKVTEPSITTLIAEANGRADRAEKKLRDLQARVEKLTNMLTEDQLEAARVMSVDALAYLTELLKIKQPQLRGGEEDGMLAPYTQGSRSFGNGYVTPPSPVDKVVANK